MTLLVSLVLVALANSVLGGQMDDRYGDVIQMDISDGTNAISRFLGFQCPKGYRCLPVLECLPCDYGSFKSDMGSDLCDLCPSGCTTLRKGAESWKECIPKCPPGYEESECGKTCTKCLPGFYKSNWRNVKCNQCPSRANYNRNKVGMTKRRQCFGDDYTTEQWEPVSTNAPVTPTGCSGLGECDADEYSDTRLVPAPGSNCTQFCQCAYQAGSTGEQQSHNWVLHDCPTGLMFNAYIKVCDYPYNVQCVDTTLPPTPSPSVTQGLSGSSVSGSGSTEVSSGSCEAIGPCDELQYARQRLLPAPGSDCTQFCQCANRQISADGNNEFYWQIMSCGPGTLFDVTIQVCNHDYAVDCAITTTTPLPTATIPGGLGCSALGPCNEHQYNEVRLRPLPGSGCTQFCQCAYNAGSTGIDQSYYWVQHNCAVGTLFNEDIRVCDHIGNVQCIDTPVPTTPSPPVTSGLTESTAPGGSGSCEAIGPCDELQYARQRLLPAPGSDCTQFCQCANRQITADGNNEFYWQIMPCGPGTLFDVTIQVCNHDYAVDCTITRTTPLPTPTIPGGLGCSALGPCNEHQYNDVRLRPLPGSGCTQFCQCAYNARSTGIDQSYYWVQHNCAAGTLFNEDIRVCDHIENVQCVDTPVPTTSSPPVTSGLTESTVPGGTGSCEAIGPCDELQYARQRLLPAPGSDCTQFCQCANRQITADGNNEFYWQIMPCGPGTLFDVTLQVCNHESEVSCLPPTTPYPGLIVTETTGSQGCSALGVCDADQYNDVRLLASPGSSCAQFCQCAFDEGSTGIQQHHYWVLHNCPEGTLFDETIKVCNHMNDVPCAETTTPDYNWFNQFN